MRQTGQVVGREERRTEEGRGVRKARDRRRGGEGREVGVSGWQGGEINREGDIGRQVGRGVWEGEKERGEGHKQRG